MALVATATIGTGLGAWYLVLTPARLTTWAQRALAGRFVGDVTLAEVAWQWPATLLVRGVRVRMSPGTPCIPELTLGRASLQLQLWPLLQRRLALGPLRVADGCIRLRPVDAKGAPTWALVAALTRRHSPPGGGAEGRGAPSANGGGTTGVSAWPIDLGLIDVSNVDVVIDEAAPVPLRGPAHQITMRGLGATALHAHITSAGGIDSYAVDGQLSLRALAVQVGGGPTPPHEDATSAHGTTAPASIALVLGPISLDVQAAAMHVQGGQISARARHLGLRTRGLDLLWRGEAAFAGDAAANGEATASATGHAEASLDFNAPLWSQLLRLPLVPAAKVSWAPKGRARLTLDARRDGEAQVVTAALDAAGLHLGGIPIEGGGGTLRWQSPWLEVQGARLDTDGGAVAASGRAQLDAAHGRIGPHQLDVALQHLPLHEDIVAAALGARFAVELHGQLTLAGQQLFPTQHTALEVDLHGHTLAPPAAPTPKRRPALGLGPPAAWPQAMSLQLMAHLRGTHAALERLRLTADAARLTGRGELDIVGAHAFALQASLQHRQPDILLRQFVPGLFLRGVEATAHLAGTVGDPRGHGLLKLSGLRWRRGADAGAAVMLPWRLGAGIAQLGPLQVHGSDVAADGTLQARLVRAAGPGEGRVPTLGQLDGELHVRRLALATLAPRGTVSGQASADLRVLGWATAPRLLGQLDVAALQLGHLAFVGAHARWRATPSSIRLQHLTLLPHGGGEIAATARFDAPAVNAGATRVANLRASPAAEKRDVAGAGGTHASDAATTAAPPASGGPWRVAAQMRAHDVPARWLGLRTATPVVAQASLDVAGHTHDVAAGFAARVGHVLASAATLRLQPERKSMYLALAAAGELATLADWSPMPAAASLAGEVHLDVTATGDWSAPAVAAHLAGRNLAQGGQPLGNGRLALQVTTPATSTYHAQLDALGLMRAQAQARLAPCPAGDVHVQVDHLSLAQLPQLGLQGVRAQASGQAWLRYRSHLGDAPSELALTVELTDLDAEAAGQHLTLMGPARFVVDPGAARLEPTLRLAGSAGHIDVGGQLTGPWRDASDAAAARTELTLAAAGDVDLQFVSSLVPALGFASGQLGWHAGASGTRARPSAHAAVDVARPWTWRPRGTLVEVRVDTGRLALTPDRLDVQAVRGRIEAGRFELGGHIDLLGALPSAYNVWLTAHDLPLHTADLVLEANVQAEAKGTGPWPTIAGRIDVTRGRFIKKLSLQDLGLIGREPKTAPPVAQTSPWLSHIPLDLKVATPDGIDIDVDAGALAVHLTLQSDLRVTGPAIAPHLGGRIAAQRGSLNFPKATLTLDQAVVDIEPTPQDPIGAVLAVVASGEVSAPSGGPGGGNQSYNVSLRLDGPLRAPTFDLTSDQGLGKLEILSLLTTGSPSFSNGTGGQLDAVLAFAGAQISGPLTQLAQRQLERMLHVHLDLGAEVTQGAVRLTAGKDVSRRLRLEGAYTQGIAADQASVSTRAQLSVTDRLLLEGTATRDMSDAAAGSSSSDAVQSNVELKYRLLGP